jgi:hypothetical protein
MLGFDLWASSYRVQFGHEYADIAQGRKNFRKRFEGARVDVSNWTAGSRHLPNPYDRDGTLFRRLLIAGGFTALNARPNDTVLTDVTARARTSIRATLARNASVAGRAGEGVGGVLFVAVLPAHEQASSQRIALIWRRTLWLHKVLSVGLPELCCLRSDVTFSP